MSMRPFALLAVLAFVTAVPIDSRSFAAPPQDLDKKVVLANPAKYVVGIRIGKEQRNIEPKKASVLSPKRYPVTIEYWSGKPETGWVRNEVASAGIYDFRWKDGQWSLNRRAKRTAGAATSRSTPPRPSYSQSPSYS
jgi:hypothetical protein